MRRVGCTAHLPTLIADKVVELLTDPQSADAIVCDARWRKGYACQWSSNLAVLDEVSA